MGNGILGKFIYFWIFVLGGFFFARVFGLPDDTETTIKLVVILVLVYVGWMLIKTKGEKRAAEKKAAMTAMPKKHNNKKKKRKK